MAKRSNINKFRSEFRRKGGGSRHTVMKILGGKLDKDSATYHKEHYQFEDDKDGPRVLDVVATSTCSFGHTVDDKVRVAGICEIGNEVLCSTEGCALNCVHCGSVVCRIHSSTFDEVTYCRRHTWIHYWRMFWRLD